MSGLGFSGDDLDRLAVEIGAGLGRILEAVDATPEPMLPLARKMAVRILEAATEALLEGDLEDESTVLRLGALLLHSTPDGGVAVELAPKDS